jgi:hypothetical protein
MHRYTIHFRAPTRIARTCPTQFKVSFQEGPDATSRLDISLDELIDRNGGPAKDQEHKCEYVLVTRQQDKRQAWFVVYIIANVSQVSVLVMATAPSTC